MSLVLFIQNLNPQGIVAVAIVSVVSLFILNIQTHKGITFDVIPDVVSLLIL